jgi:vacuole morphology and inheritance protein 14
VSVNKLMLDLVRSKEEKSEVLKHLDLSSVMDILKQYLMHRSVTKVAVLKWINHLFIEFHDQVIQKN